MTLTRLQRPSAWGLTPWRSTNSVSDELNRLFEAFDTVFDSPLGLARTAPFAGGWLPAIDLYESKDNVTVKAELPGLRKEDISISLQDGLLSLSGERKVEEKYEDAEVSRAERVVGRFHRTISLPSKVNADAIKATYTDGVLTVVLPKAEDSKPKQIKIAFN